MNVVSELMHQNRSVGGATDEQRLDLHVLVDVVRRRGRIVLMSVAVCLGLAIAYLVTTPASYTATAVLMTDTKQTPPSPSQVTSEPLIDPAVIESQIEILKSEHVALDVVDRLHLDTDPEFIGSGPGWKARLLDALFHKPATAPTEEDRRISAVNALMHKVKVLRTGHSYLADIAVTTLDPVKSAKIANAIADAYIQDQLDGRMQANQRAAAWMKQRVDEVKAQAEAAAAALETFRRQNAAVLSAHTAAKPGVEQGPPPRDEARLALALYQSQIDKLTALAPSGTIEPLTAAKLDGLSATNDPSLQHLADALRQAGLPDAGRAPTGAQAEIVARIQQRLTQLLAESRDKLKSAADEVAAAARQAATTQSTAAAGDEANRRLKSLTAAAAAAQGDADALQNRYVRVTQFMQQQSLPVTEARLVTAAQPPLAKSAPKSSVILLLAMVGGLVLGGAFVMLRESLDRRIRWPQQIKRDLGLPLAGALPLAKTAPAVVRPTEQMAVSRLEAKLIGQPPSGLVTLFDSRRPWCGATQTLRIIKLAIDHGVRRNGGAVVGIVSAWPGEGKSTLAHNLAQMLSETRTRVLVIDADFGKPDLSTTFAPQGERGIADLIDGVAPIDQCVAPTGFGFDLLGCGGVAPLHPFHLLGSPQMQRALAAAQQTYDYTIIDLPALMVSVDSQAVAGFVDAFVLVTDYGRTTVDDVEQALMTSDVIAARTVATVLNRSRLADRNGRRATRGHRSSVVKIPA